MRLVIAIWVATSLSIAVAAEPKDPKTLDVPAEKRDAAKKLVAKLDDDDILVRDKATRELRVMGRDALPAMLAALKAKPADRVLDRLAELLPPARKADFDHRYPLFLADKDRKFDHDLPGWNELKAAVKDTKESRLLMADILADQQCRDVLVAAFDFSRDGRKAFEKRWESKRNEWRDARPAEPAEPTKDEPIHWLLAALLADLVYSDDYHTDFRWFIVHVYLKTDEGRLAVVGKGKYGAVPSALAKHWIEQQTGSCGLGVSQSIARDFKLDESVIRRIGEKRFDLFVRTGKAMGGPLEGLAHTRDPNYIASFRRLFDVDTTYRKETDDKKLSEIQVRDAALSMCIALSGQDPVDYGFSAQTTTDPKSDSRYWIDNYRFDDSGGTTVDEKRKAAFKKWAEWEKANPDAIKAKPPEKKDK